MNRILLASLSVAALLSQPVLADDAHHPKPETAVVAQAAAMTEGEVRKVDKAARKITLKHGPIVNLDMPGMTMVFHVKDSKMLEQVKAGDKVRFSAEKIGEDITVTKIEPAR
jgi:Cu(I)/Ag(I) efflux system periplasmic protein CusF